MLVLWEHQNLTVKALGAELYLDSGTLTPLLKKLEEKGLVNRKRSMLDERNLIVSLTPAGEKMKNEALSIPAELAKYVVLDRDEVLTLYRLLYKLLGRNETLE